MDVTKLKKSPKCPWCGNVMKIETEDRRPKVPQNSPQYCECAEDWQFVAYFTCDMCSHRTGTTIKAPQSHGSDLKEAMIGAFVEAVTRPLQKPLELAQLEALISAGEDVAVYCEAKGEPHAYATILFAGQVISPNGDKINACDLVYFHYGKTWRAWVQRPDDEERAAAPWEGTGNADL